MPNNNRFFENAAEGVNMLNGFVKISVGATVELVQHHADLRQRFCLQYSYRPKLTAVHSGLLEALVGTSGVAIVLVCSTTARTRVFGVEFHKISLYGIKYGTDTRPSFAEGH